MQKWEYKTIQRKRKTTGAASANEPGYATSWDSIVESQLNSLGEEGWQLVTVQPRSGMSGYHYAGFDSEELWVFKRPKP